MSGDLDLIPTRELRSSHRGTYGVASELTPIISDVGQFEFHCGFHFYLGSVISGWWQSNPSTYGALHDQARVINPACMY